MTGYTLTEMSVSLPSEAVIAAIAAIGGAAVTHLLGGLGFLARRRITGAAGDEKLDRINKTIDLLTKMKAFGVPEAEIQHLGSFLRRSEIMSNDTVQKIVQDSAQVVQRDEFHSNYAMKMRAGTALNVAEAELDRAIVDLKLLLRPDEEHRFAETQVCWAAYRDALSSYAHQQFDGGTHASLAAALTAVAETERRTAEIQAELAERGKR